MSNSVLGITGYYTVYTEKLRNKQIRPKGFANSLSKATLAYDNVASYKSSLENKFGVPIMVTSVGKSQSSMDNFAAGTIGSGNVAIAPNILEQMANDPEKAAYYERRIQEHFDSLPASEAFLASRNLRMTTSGVVIHADGTVTYYCSAEETPEYKAKVEADHKAKREKEAKLRKEGIERSQKVAEERKRIQEESLRKINFESFWYSRIISSQYFVFEDTVDKRLAAYEMENTDL